MCTLSVLARDAREHDTCVQVGTCVYREYGWAGEHECTRIHIHVPTHGKSCTGTHEHMSTGTRRWVVPPPTGTGPPGLSRSAEVMGLSEGAHLGHSTSSVGPHGLCWLREIPRAPRPQAPDDGASWCPEEADQNILAATAAMPTNALSLPMVPRGTVLALSLPAPVPEVTA